MRRILTALLLSGICSISFIKGQSSYESSHVVLERLFSRLALNSDDNDRIRINDSIKSVVNKYVESDSVFTTRFSGIRNLGQITSSDSRLKIITWNLILKESPGRYFCYMIHKEGRGKEGKIYKLSGTYSPAVIRTDTTYSEKNWYGALYYDLKPVKKDNRSWILLGLDYGNPEKTRKIIEVVTFTPEGTLLFGRKWFSSGEMLKYREVLEYSYTAVISLRFLSDKLIVFDHLVPVSPELKGKREYYAPDYSYDAYNYEKGIWRFKEDIDVRNIKH